MSKLFKSVFALLLCLMTLTGCSLLTNEGDYESAVTQGQAAPDFTLVNQAGETVSLKDFAGKKVYINVWASWCGPCKQEIPELDKVYQAYKDTEDVVFLAIASPNDDKYGNTNPADKDEKTILETATKAGATYPIYFDTKDNFMKTFSVRAFPTHIMINSDGTVASTLAGSATEETVLQMIGSAH